MGSLTCFSNRSWETISSGVNFQKDLAGDATNKEQTSLENGWWENIPDGKKNMGRCLGVLAGQHEAWAAEVTEGLGGIKVCLQVPRSIMGLDSYANDS